MGRFNLGLAMSVANKRGTVDSRCIMAVEQTGGQSRITIAEGFSGPSIDPFVRPV